MRKQLLGFVLLSFLNAGDEPKISLEQQADYLQAKAEFVEAQLNYINTKDKLEDVVKKLNRLAGSLEATAKRIDNLKFGNGSTKVKAQ